MTNKEYLDVCQCSSGTFAAITGLRTYDQVTDFARWIYDHMESVEWHGNALLTVHEAWEICKAQYSLLSHQESDQAQEKVTNPVDQARGMNVEDARAFLKSRGLESLVPGGFETLNRMQQKR